MKSVALFAAVLVSALGCSAASSLTVEPGPVRTPNGFTGDDGPAGIGDPFEAVDAVDAGCPPGQCAFVPASARVVQTSKAGDKLRDLGTMAFAPGSADGPAVVVDLGAPRQEIVGFGPAFTESAAHTLMHVSPGLRAKVLVSLFGPAGAAFTLTRTHIASCDFGPVGNYSYSNRPDLSDFSVAEDDPDLIPLIKDAAAVPQASFRIVANTWTSPPFTKDNGMYYDTDALRGGRLLPEHYGTFAKYVSKYLTAYHDRGIDIWAVTPENEPLGNGGHWESMEFTPEEMTRYVVRNLGPTLAADHPGVKILHFDHNRDQVEAWTTSLFTEPDAPKYVAGTATHWYASSYLVFSDGLDRIHAARGDDHLIINTEAAIGTGTIDSGLYFGVWSYFWTVRGSSAHSSSANFPATSPIGHYLTDIVGGLNHWMNGWIEWNLALDRQGGPRHICDPSITRCGCMAPVMVDTDAGQLFYTPIYYVLSHFSKFIRPGARVLTTVAPAGLIATAAQNSNGTVAVVVVNSFNHPSEYASVVDRDYAIQIGQRSVSVHIPAHAIQTVLVTP